MCNLGFQGGGTYDIRIRGCAYEGSNTKPKICVHQNCISEILVHDANLLPKNMGAKFCF